MNFRKCWPRITDGVIGQKLLQWRRSAGHVSQKGEYRHASKETRIFLEFKTLCGRCLCPDARCADFRWIRRTFSFRRTQQGQRVHAGLPAHLRRGFQAIQETAERKGYFITDKDKDK